MQGRKKQRRKLLRNVLLCVCVYIDVGKNFLFSFDYLSDGLVSRSKDDKKENWVDSIMEKKKKKKGKKSKQTSEKINMKETWVD